MESVAPRGELLRAGPGTRNRLLAVVGAPVLILVPDRGSRGWRRGSEGHARDPEGDIPGPSLPSPAQEETLLSCAPPKILQRAQPSLAPLFPSEIGTHLAVTAIPALSASQTKWVGAGQAPLTLGAGDGVEVISRCRQFLALIRDQFPAGCCHLPASGISIFRQSFPPALNACIFILLPRLWVPGWWESGAAVAPETTRVTLPLGPELCRQPETLVCSLGGLWFCSCL